VDDSRSGSYPHHNDFASKFSLIRVWFCSKFRFCFVVHDTVYEYEFTMFSVLRLHLVLSLVFCVCCHTQV
jgi:hypothetical protein